MNLLRIFFRNDGEKLSRIHSSFAKVGCKPIVALFCEQTKNLRTKTVQGGSRSVVYVRIQRGRFVTRAYRLMWQKDVHCFRLRRHRRFTTKSRLRESGGGKPCLEHLLRVQYSPVGVSRLFLSRLTNWTVMKSWNVKVSFAISPRMM